jgi:putative endonuclease
VLYFTYILECADGTLYCGSTNNMERRLRAHNSLKSGAKYTRGRRPVVVRYCEAFKTPHEARQREAAIKAMPRAEKQALFA